MKIKYESIDGKIFDDKESCEEYEKTIIMTRQEAWEIVKEMETAMVGDRKLNMAAMGTNWCDTDELNYFWYKPKNQREVNALNEYYNLNFQNNRIGKWVGVETSMDLDECSDCKYDTYESLDIEYAMQNTITFWEALGYKITIFKRRK